MNLKDDNGTWDSWEKSYISRTARFRVSLDVYRFSPRLWTSGEQSDCKQQLLGWCLCIIKIQFQRGLDLVRILGLMTMVMTMVSWMIINIQVGFQKYIVDS